MTRKALAVTKSSAMKELEKLTDRDWMGTTVRSADIDHWGQIEHEHISSPFFLQRKKGESNLMNSKE